VSLDLIGVCISGILTMHDGACPGVRAFLWPWLDPRLAHSPLSCAAPIGLNSSPSAPYLSQVEIVSVAEGLQQALERGIVGYIKMAVSVEDCSCVNVSYARDRRLRINHIEKDSPHYQRECGGHRRWSRSGVS
jgi:hypothetical protein